MSSEIEVTETPNWLQELEAKRERRLKARLGHETGAGAPCLKCGDKCPGLDLHFWRKCCKICKCSKEEHEVQDDDIYGWAQFQLLGNKPNKIKRKIVLPGKKDEVELDWAPKGHNDTVDKYLKTLPPEQLPVKGSQAAQDRKQLLQKQIPIHDIDPTLCHELSVEELKQMNEYISHVKQTSVGIGQIVSLSSIIKGNLHTLNPAEAAIIASRYAKGVPLSEIVKLQSQSKASLLKPDLAQNLAKMNLGMPNTLNQTERSVSPMVANKIHDVTYPGYARDINQALPNAQFSTGLKPGQFGGYDSQGQFIDPSIDEKYLQNPNFDPKKVPSQFIHQKVPYGNLPYDENSSGFVSADGAGHFQTPNMPYNKSSAGYKSGAGGFQDQNTPYDRNSVGHQSGDGSAFVPYSKVSTGVRPGENYVEDGTTPGGNYAQRLPGRNLAENIPNYARNNPRAPNSPFNNATVHNITDEQSASLGAEELRRNNAQGLPNYAPGKYNVYADIQSPTKIPKNVRDLAFSTYDPSNVDPNELQGIDDNTKMPNVPFDNYPAGYVPENTTGNNYAGSGRPLGQQNLNQIDNNSPGRSFDQNVPNRSFDPRHPYNQQVVYDPNVAQKAPYSQQVVGGAAYNPNIQQNSPYNQQVVGGGSYDPNPPHNAPYNQQVVGGGSYDPNVLQNTPYNQQIVGGGAYDPNVPRNAPYNQQVVEGGAYDPNVPHNAPYNQQVVGGHAYDPNVLQNAPYNQQIVGGGAHDPNVPRKSPYNPQVVEGGAYDPNIQQNSPYNQQIVGGGAYDPSVPYGQQNENYPNRLSPGRQGGPGTKKLSELHPGKMSINEDFLEPSQVNIGAIQDINYPEIKAATHGTNDFYEDYSPDSLREILNNIKLPDCHYCKKPFEENEFAITIDRANVLFHAECFKCAGCNQILADNVYFYNKETDNIYCGRDYAKIRGFPRCKACDELIFTKEYCLAENSTFHLKHFCCIECDRPLAGQDYTLEDEMPYCLPCFEQSKASKCSACCRVIKPDEIGCNLNGVHFHAVDECFACKMCKRPLMGKKLLLRNQKLYCSHDCFGADK